jgi:hypothetical protein
MSLSSIASSKNLLTVHLVLLYHYAQPLADLSIKINAVLTEITSQWHTAGSEHLKENELAKTRVQV